MQVFIAVLIVEKHDVATVRAPVLPGDRPAPGARDGLPRRDLVGQRHPDIEHAISRGKPRDQTAVRRQFRVEKRRVIEQLSSGDQGAKGHIGFSCTRMSGWLSVASRLGPIISKDMAAPVTTGVAKLICFHAVVARKSWPANRAALVACDLLPTVMLQNVA
jgi:hypothetical protein